MHTRHSIFALVLPFIIFPHSVLAKTITVSSGSNLEAVLNDGCSDTTACPGDIVNVMPGTYTDTNNDGAVVAIRNSGSGGKNPQYIIIQATPTAGKDTPVSCAPAHPSRNCPIIDGKNQASTAFDIADYVSYVKIVGFEIKNTLKSGVSIQDWDGDPETSSKSIVLSQNYIHDIATCQKCVDTTTIGRAGMFIHQASDIVISRNFIGAIGNTLGNLRKQCSLLGRYCLDHGIYVKSGDTILIENNIFAWPANNAGWAIHLYGNGKKNNITISHNTFDGGTHSLTDAGAIILGSNAGDEDIISNLKIDYNLFHNTHNHFNIKSGYAINNIYCDQKKRYNISINKNLIGTSRNTEMSAIGKNICSYWPNYSELQLKIYSNDTPFIATERGDYRLKPGSSSSVVTGINHINDKTDTSDR